MKKHLRLLGLLLLILLSAALGVRVAHAQVGADRVAVTGLVTDPSGASVPNATVTLINEDTGVRTVIATNGAGNFTTPAVVLGPNYTLEVKASGFMTYTHGGLDLTIGGRTYTQDVKLSIGATTQTVQVTASAQLIDTQSPTVSYQVGQQYYRDLPDVMGADVRLAESKLILSPGYVPTAPNGDAIFRGDAFESRINGGQTVSWESWFDGAEYGYAEGHQQTHESSIPYASVLEMTTTVNNFSAQYGHTSGGLALYTTKSGTSKFHGNLYDFYTSSGMDAGNFFLNNAGIPILPLTQNNSGFDFGGPIPKIHKWGKTFWFTNYDRLDYHSTVNIGYQNTLPTVPERSGDFSALLNTNNVIGTDALGRPIYQGEIFNPATTRTVNGVPVRDPYPGNIIPATDPLMTGNAGGLKVASLIPPLDRNTIQNNEFGGTSDDNDKINVWTWLLRVDHTFSPKWSASLTWFQNYRPRTAHCGGPQGCNTAHNGETDPQANNTYIGQGFYQLITNHFAHLQLNWVIKPNLFNHATFSYDRWVMNGHQLSSGVGWNQQLGLGLPNQPIFNNAGFPSLNFAGTVPYTSYGTPWLGNGSDINNRYQFYDDLTWIVARHTVKMGIQSEYINFPQTGWAVNTGGSFSFNALSTGGYDKNGNNLSATGDGFASFLLGQVYSAGFTIPMNYMPKIYYAAPWINDEWKARSNLTLTFGLRLDWNSGLSEQHNRFSTFVPTAPNPAAGNIPGADVFNSKLANGNDAWGLGPRFGFAYQMGKNSVIRGGYGLYYGATIADSWDPYPVDGYQTNPTAPNTTNGEFPAFYFGSGFPASAITVPPVLNASVMNGGSPVAVSPNNYEMPRWQDWSVSFQHQWRSDISIDVAYVGNHGTRLPDDRASAGLLQNENPASVLNYGAAVLAARIVNGVPDPVAAAAGIQSPYPGFNGSVAQALRPFPQYQGILWRKTHDGKSIYNSLQAQFNKHGRHSSFTVSYTLSRLMNNGAESGQEGGLAVQNPSNMSDLWGPSADDVPNILTVGEVYNLPFGKGEWLAPNATGVLGKLITGWKVNGILSYESGRPQTMFVANNLGGLLFNYAKFPDLVSGQDPVNRVSYTNPFGQSYYNSNAFSVPAPLAFGDSPRSSTNIRGFHYYNEDVSVFKDTYFGENKYVRFEAEAGNIFNRVDFCPPDSTVTDPNFGHTFTQCNIPRRVQFGLQVFF